MKLFLAILSGIIIGGATGLGIFYHHELTNFRVAAWKYPPVVVDCTFGALDEERIHDAIKYWDDLNHKVGFGFTNNRQHSLGKLYRTSNSLAKKLYEIL